MPPPSPTLLLIDDSLADLRVLTEIMAAQGMRVSVARNGKEGYERAGLQRPDLILLDVRMPEMDGFATCRLLKADPRTRAIPVLFLSAAAAPEERVRGLTLGAVDYIGKPFHRDEVIARVNIHLQLGRREREDERAGETPAAPAALTLRALATAAAEHLRAHLDAPPSTAELARLFGTHEKRLSQAFQHHFAMTVYDWLREERLRRARHLLATTDTPIAPIADLLGYATPANFSRAFRDRFGCSPSELRRGLGRE